MSGAQSAVDSSTPEIELVGTPPKDFEWQYDTYTLAPPVDNDKQTILERIEQATATRKDLHAASWRLGCTTPREGMVSLRGDFAEWISHVLVMKAFVGEYVDDNLREWVTEYLEKPPNNLDPHTKALFDKLNPKNWFLRAWSLPIDWLHAWNDRAHPGNISELFGTQNQERIVQPAIAGASRGPKGLFITSHVWRAAKEPGQDWKVLHTRVQEYEKTPWDVEAAREAWTAQNFQNVPASSAHRPSSQTTWTLQHFQQIFSHDNWVQGTTTEEHSVDEWLLTQARHLKLNKLTPEQKKEKAFNLLQSAWIMGHHPVQSLQHYGDAALKNDEWAQAFCSAALQASWDQIQPAMVMLSQLGFKDNLGAMVWDQWHRRPKDNPELPNDWGQLTIDDSATGLF